jgi:hypothetical protein
MLVRGTEQNSGLCGGLSADRLEEMHAAGVIDDHMSVASLAVARCVLCHLAREKPIIEAEVMEDTRLGQIASERLGDLTVQGLLEKEVGSSIPEAGSTGEIAASEGVVYGVAKGSTVITEFSGTVPVPASCPQLHGWEY